jgi:hypothetical protein
MTSLSEYYVHLTQGKLCVCGKYECKKKLRGLSPQDTVTSDNSVLVILRWMIINACERYILNSPRIENFTIAIALNSEIFFTICLLILVLKLRGLVRQQTIPTERPPLVSEVNANFSGQRVSRGQRNKFPTAVNFSFLDRSRYCPFK